MVMAADVAGFIYVYQRVALYSALHLGGLPNERVARCRWRRTSQSRKNPTGYRFSCTGAPRIQVFTLAAGRAIESE